MAIDFSEEFKEYWDTKGHYKVMDNPGRTRDNICRWLKTCRSVCDIDNHVCNLRTRKETTRRIIVEFLDYLSNKTGTDYNSILAEKRFYDYPFERQLEIAKFLHEPHTAAEIEERFDVNSETRKKDIRALRDGIEVLGSTIRIDVERRGRKMYYSCTTHPVFLPLNLTEVYALTVYMPSLVRRWSPNSEIINELAERAKAQLSDYAFEKLFPGERRHVVNNDYVNDADLARDRKGILMYLMKSGAYCKFFWNKMEYRGKIIKIDSRYKIQLDDRRILEADPENPHEVEFIIESLEYR